MKPGIRILTDIEGKKEFDKTMAEYVQWTKRAPAEIINAKLYFIAVRAMGLTKKGDRDTILEKLRQPSKSAPSVPVEAILVNWALGKQGKKGLRGDKMKKAIERLEKKSVSRLQFLRSGWLPAVKGLDYWNRKGDINFSKRFAPKKPSPAPRQYGQPKGSVIAAKLTDLRPVMFGSITNSVALKGKQHNEHSKAPELIMEGLKLAVRDEISSMQSYIRRKYQEQFNKMASNKR